MRKQKSKIVLMQKGNKPKILMTDADIAKLLKEKKLEAIEFILEII